MNKKIILPVFLLVIVIAGILLWGSREKIDNQIGSGSVLELKDSSVVVQGYLIAPDQEKKVINVEFLVDKNTSFKKMTMLVDVKKYSDGKPFTPEMVETVGSLSDLVRGTKIRGVITDDKLVDKGTAKALEIQYTGVSFQ